MEPAISVEEVNAYLDEHMPGDAVVEEIRPDFAKCRWPHAPEGTRPGGGVSGPTMMGLIDLAAWCAVFSRAGIVPMAVTWELKVNFLRPAHGGDIIAEAQQHKFGRLCYSSIDIYVDGNPDKLVAHATTTYAMPAET